MPTATGSTAALSLHAILDSSSQSMCIVIIYNQAPYCLQNAIYELDQLNLLEPGLTFMIVEIALNIDLYLCIFRNHAIA